MKHILISTGLYPPEIGGPATYTKLLEDELPKRGFKVSVLPFSTVRHLPKIVRHIAYFFKVLRSGKDVDLIYAQDPVSVGLPSIIASKILGKNFFIRIAGDYAWEQFQQSTDDERNVSIEEFQYQKFDFVTELKKKIERWVAKKSDKIIVPSKYFKKIIEKWGVDSEKINVIYNGIYLSTEGLERGENKKEKIMISVGRLVPWKGFKELIEMMPYILESVPEVKLHIIGNGPQRAELEKVIRDLNLSKKVLLLGKISRRELLMRKRLSDIFIFNTHWESFSFDTVESMSLGLPVITTNIGPLPELIENDKDGVLVEPDNKEQIKNAIVKVLQNDNFRLSIIKNARKKSKKFSIQNTVNELEKLLNAEL